MQLFPTPSDLAARAGQDLGASDWLLITQPMIDGFAAATGDRQWIHTDPLRAARELPGGRTIAHGYLLISLFPQLFDQVWQIERRSRALNYGSDRVRFLAPVPVGARVRLAIRLATAEPITGGWRFAFASTMDLEGADRPALIAQTLSVSYD